MVGIPSSMGVHQLDVRYGDRNTLPYYNGIVATAILSNASLRIGLLDAGRVMSLTTATRLTPGILATAGSSGGPVPFYAWSGYDNNNYPDVYRTRGMPGMGVGQPAEGSPGAPGFYGIPTGAITDPLAGVFATIAHVFGGELSSTEFDTGATYTPGQLLTAVSATASTVELLNRGKLRPQALATDVVVGIVAPAGKFTNAAGYPCLAFYPTYVAGTTVPAVLTP